MPSRYFENLPNMFYANTLCKDITRRVVTIDTESNAPFTFYPYDLEHDLRSDHVAEYYFEDSDLDWLIYISNRVIDPYYEWPLNDREFEIFVEDKHGSSETAKKRIKYYMNNWAEDDTEITTSYYETNLAGILRKYWTPNFSPAGKILSYKRKEENVLMNTNQILKYTIQANNTNYAFANGELVDINTATGTVGTGEIISSNATNVTIFNVAGNTSANVTHTKFLVGETSEANVTANNVTTVKENITTDEFVYWTPIYHYDYEQFCNQRKKSMTLPDVQHTTEIVDDFFDLVNEDINLDTRLPLEE